MPNNQSPLNPLLLSSGQASLYGAILSLAGPENPPPMMVLPQTTVLPPAPLRGPTWPSPNESSDGDADDDSGSEKSEEDDPEGVKQAMCTTVAPDANVETNALPFVLQSCKSPDYYP